ncbi:MAG: histidine kinase [Saprospiraceae bacterium]
MLSLSPTQKSIGRHLLFWAAVILLYYFIEVTRGKPELFGYILVRQLPCDMLATYFTYYVIVEKFLLKKRYWAAGIFFLLSAVVITILAWTVFYYTIIPVVYPNSVPESWLHGPGMIQVGIGLYYIAFPFAALKLYRIWQRNKEDQQEMEKQHLKSELALLRAQINPHFLFNTLNNIDTLVFEDQARASESIVKLSGIMRYMLFDANAEQVPLEKEIECLQNFIDLHRLRLKQADFIDFEVEGDPRGHLVPAMLFLPFVENTFKHGSMQGPSPGIIVNIQIHSDRYLLRVVNRLRTRQVPYEVPSGVGLQNVRRRLELIYGQDYDLSVNQTEDQYTVQLMIPQRAQRSGEIPTPEKPLLELVKN